MNYVRFSTSLAIAIATTVCVAAAGYGGMWIAAANNSVISPFWPASGVAVAAILVWGWPALGGAFAGVLASNIYSALPGIFCVAGATAFAGESALAAAIVRAFLGKDARLDDLRGVLAIVVGAAWLPPLVNALLFGRVLPIADGVPFLADTGDIMRFVLANGFGIALITPAFLVWGRTSVEGWWWKMPAVLLASAGVAWIVFGLGEPSFLLLIPLLAAAVATGLRGTSVICAITAVAVVVLSGLGFGPLVTPEGTDYSRLYSLFAVLAFGILPVGAASGEYRRILRQRRAAEKAAGLRFWEWNDVDGLRFEGGDAPEKLFDAMQDRGSLETKHDGHEALSFWQTMARAADGKPREVAGMVIDASERMQLEKTRRKSWEAEVELRNLRASLTPHLLFNCLAAMRGIVRTEPEKARSFIDTLSRFLRESTDAQSREAIPLHEEWQLCEDFLGLQSLRYERDLPRVADIEGPAHHAKIPPMMLLNLVENAVKHGEITQAHPLVVRAVQRDGRLSIEVRNRGNLGPSPEGRPGGTGTAAARLKAIYGPAASLAIRQDGEDVSAVLEMPAATPERGTGPE